MVARGGAVRVDWKWLEMNGESWNESLSYLTVLAHKLPFALISYFVKGKGNMEAIAVNCYVRQRCIHLNSLHSFQTISNHFQSSSNEPPLAWTRSIRSCFLTTENYEGPDISNFTEVKALTRWAVINIWFAHAIHFRIVCTVDCALRAAPVMFDSIQSPIKLVEHIRPSPLYANVDCYYFTRINDFHNAMNLNTPKKLLAINYYDQILQY